MKRIEIKGNGAHCGLTDWYPYIEKQIKECLTKGEDFTTGWYASKKELASAKITMKNHKLKVEVNIYDDFDIEGYGSMKMHFRRYSRYWNENNIRKLIDGAWDAAERDQKSNYWFSMYAIYQWNKETKRNVGVETYLFDVYGDDLGEPPGDNYHDWGWQEGFEMPEKTKEKLIREMHAGKNIVHFGGYTAKKVFGPRA